MLVDKRIDVQKPIEAHFATLRKVESESCLLASHSVSDIVLRSHHLERVRRRVGEQRSIPGHFDTRLELSGLELHIFGGGILEGSADVFTMVAKLPRRFSKLYAMHLSAGEGTPEATDAGLVFSKLSVKRCR